MSNTSHVHFSRRLLLSKDAAVFSNILRLDVFDVHLSYLPFLYHLISPSVIELVLRLPPLHRHPGSGQFTVKRHVASFAGLLVLQAHFKSEWNSCGCEVKHKNSCCVVLWTAECHEVHTLYFKSKRLFSSLRAPRRHKKKKKEQYGVPLRVMVMLAVVLTSP